MSDHDVDGLARFGALPARPIRDLPAPSRLYIDTATGSFAAQSRVGVGLALGCISRRAVILCFTTG